MSEDAKPTCADCGCEIAPGEASRSVIRDHMPRHWTFVYCIRALARRVKDLEAERDARAWR